MTECVRATLTPYQTNGKDLDESESIPFDFNPETLTLKVQSGEQKDRRRRGNQQVQNVGASTATLSFEAIFDMTRPASATDTRVREPEENDVRTKTGKIAALLQVEKKGKKPAPRRVRFCWGSFVFDGIVKSHSETFDYFSPDGVPLRSKVSVAIDEQDFRYSKEPRKAASQRASGGDAGNATANATGGGSSASDGARPPADLSLGIDIGLDVDVGLQAGAGIPLDAKSSFEVFGADAIEAGIGAAVDLGRSIGSAAGRALSSARSITSVAPGPWAPDGPTPGTAAAEIASLVHAQRAFGRSPTAPRRGAGQFSASRPVEPIASTTGGPSSARTGAPVTGEQARAISSTTPRPIPVVGSPPMTASGYATSTASPIFSIQHPRTPERITSGGTRPSWDPPTTEELRKAARPAKQPGATHSPGCGCASRCSCGGRGGGCSCGGDARHGGRPSW